MKVVMLMMLMVLVAGCIYGQEKGMASYYADKFHGRQTANGEIFSNDSLTAAHKTLPFGTIVTVKDKKSGKTVIVRINDRLPSNSTRTIDLSKAAAARLGLIYRGIGNVELYY